MYRCVKLKRSILNTIPILNTNSQYFHVTSAVFARKVLSRTKSKNVEPEYFEDESDAAKVSQSSHTDFFGIESDEGVITVSHRKNPIPESVQNQRKREKFYNTSFGVVRYDSDNELKYHGQYGKIMNFEFPYSSNEYVEVSKNLQNFSQQSKTSHDIQNINDEQESHFYEMQDLNEGYIDEYYFSEISKKETPINYETSNKLSEELNFVDENYFKTLNTIKDVTNNSEKNNVVHSGTNEINSIDKNYFENVSCQYENKSDIEYDSNAGVEVLANMQNFSKQALNFQGTHDGKDLVNEKASGLDKIKDLNENYIDEIYFNSSERRDSGTLDPDIRKSSEDLSFLDKNYFSTLTTIENINSSQSSERDIKNFFAFSESSKDHKITQSAVQESDMFDKNCFKNTPISETEKYSKRQDISSTNPNHPLPSIQNNLINISNNYRQTLEDDDEKSISSHIARDKLLSKRRGQLPRKNISSDVENNSGENNFKYSSFANEKPDLEDQISTAHDFATKYRKEQKTLTFKAEKAATVEKFDSKGFRILKNQVQNLSHFTLDEILNLLSNNVVYSDDDLLVLNKPYGLVIHDSKTTKDPCLSTFLDDLAKEMDQQAVNPKLFTVHRIDKETTGCLFLARNETMAQQLCLLFSQRKIIKKYWILTTRVPNSPEGVIDIPISEGSVDNKKRMVLHPKLSKDIPYRNHSKKGREAVTSYKVLSESGNAALVEVLPKTGIKHQIRVHFGFGLSCPILGDHKYSHLDKLAPQKLQSDLLQRLGVRQSKVRHIPMHIHSKTVIIPHYFENRDLLVNAPLPDHMKINLKRLKFRKKDMSH